MGEIKSPQECLMDREKLARIDRNTEDLASQFKEFVSSEGPFVDVRQRVKSLEDKTDEIISKVTGLVAKVTGIVTAIMGMAWLIITKFIGGGNG